MAQRNPNPKFKFTLDPSSKKFICPKCHKKTFVRYVESENTNTYAPEIFGRCDREIECAYLEYPKDETPTMQVKKAEPLPTPHDYSCVEATLGKASNLALFLYSQFDTETVNRVLEDYCVGSYGHWEKDTVFWRIDGQGTAWAGKVMLYHHQTGKRVKEPQNCINWVHAVRKEEGFVLDSSHLFGLHLANRNAGKPVGIVESEKTALIASILLPQYLWMATGGLGMLSAKALARIPEREIILFPDLGATTRWEDKTKNIVGTVGNVRINRVLEEIATDAERTQGADIADLLLNPERRDVLIEALRAGRKPTAGAEETATEAVEEPEFVNMWGKDSKGKAIILPDKFVIYLNQIGVRTHKEKDDKEAELVTVIDNIVDTIHLDDVRVKVNEYADSFSIGHKAIVDQDCKKIYDIRLLKQVRAIEIEKPKDTKDTCTLFFRNGFITITPENHAQQRPPQLQPYKALKKPVWRNIIIDADFTPISYTKAQESIFKRFARLISADTNENREIESINESRYLQFITAHAYLIHNYKRYSNAKAIIGVDRVIENDSQNGRNGKGIFLGQSLERFFAVATIGNFDPKKSFEFQEVTTATRLVFFDDIEKDFDYHALYTQVTNKFKIEHKHKGAFSVPFADSPKIALCSNFQVPNLGGSFADRFTQLKFSNYFNDTHKPTDEFGCEMLSEWDERELNRFYNYIAYNISYYLAKGIHHITQ